MRKIINANNAFFLDGPIKICISVGIVESRNTSIQNSEDFAISLSVFQYEYFNGIIHHVIDYKDNLHDCLLLLCGSEDVISFLFWFPQVYTTPEQSQKTRFQRSDRIKYMYHRNFPFCYNRLN